MISWVYWQKRKMIRNYIQLCSKRIQYSPFPFFWVITAHVTHIWEDIGIFVNILPTKVILLVKQINQILFFASEIRGIKDATLQKNALNCISAHQRIVKVRSVQLSGIFNNCQMDRFRGRVALVLRFAIFVPMYVKCSSYRIEKSD